MKKFILHPTKKVSFTDLVELYGIPKEECIDIKLGIQFKTGRPEFIHLFPPCSPEDDCKETLRLILELRSKDRKP